MDFRCTRKRFENPAFLEPVFEAWRKEIFDAERETEMRKRPITRGVSDAIRRHLGAIRRHLGAIRRHLGAIRRALTFERKAEMKREIWNQGLMYAIISLFVFLVVPFLRYAV